MAQTKEQRAAYQHDRYMRLTKPHLEELRAGRTEAHKSWAQKNPRKARDGQLKAKYGISIEKYEEMVAAQAGVCAICKGPPVGRGSCLVVDHDHTSSKTRSLLCARCNTMLGLAKESEETLQAAIEYLRGHRLFQ